MLGVVIGGKTMWMVTKDCPYAIEYKSGYYVSDRDYLKAYEYYKNKEGMNHGK